MPVNGEIEALLKDRLTKMQREIFAEVRAKLDSYREQSVHHKKEVERLITKTTDEAAIKVRVLTEVISALPQDVKHLREVTKSGADAVKILLARCEAMAKEIEALKKNSAGMADIAGLKKAIAELEKKKKK
ncbi:hypothetical protein PX52LOC_01852 [Limnoglobus roseus]|uniref:Uncharacterized protein n=2 Tax=Limnoglobus roseus TaxID=2598579 RepID=A0A5C1A6S1_9BACT|nr:hypothetical protein PX52LOC_01852 [Limnoglobus roseus]